MWDKGPHQWLLEVIFAPRQFGLFSIFIHPERVELGSILGVWKVADLKKRKEKKLYLKEKKFLISRLD